ncbi:hypothetical protein QFZ96_002929 [Paraburkholderia youngii]
MFAPCGAGKLTPGGDGPALWTVPLPLTRNRAPRTRD